MIMQRLEASKSEREEVWKFFWSCLFEWSVSCKDTRVFWEIIWLNHTHAKKIEKPLAI